MGSAHTSNMRTSVNLADYAREFAMHYARARGVTLGEAISDLIRTGGKVAGSPGEAMKFGRSASGFPIFPPSSREITTEMVKEALEDYI